MQAQQYKILSPNLLQNVFTDWVGITNLITAKRQINSEQIIVFDVIKIRFKINITTNSLFRYSMASSLFTTQVSWVNYDYHHTLIL